MNNASEESRSTRCKIVEKLQHQLKEYKVKGVIVEPDTNDPFALQIIIPEGLLEFKIDHSEIPPKGIVFLTSFIPKLTGTIYDKEYRSDISSIVIEGHTDSTGSDTHNIELSQSRSMSVAKECINILDVEHNLNSQNSSIRDYFLRVLSASGRGKQDLIIKYGKEDHQQSRRVVFKIRLRSFEEIKTT
jgi:chemotaxis protein MotB